MLQPLEVPGLWAVDIFTTSAAKDGKEKYFWPPRKQTLPKVWSFPTGLESVGPVGKRPLVIRLVSALKSDEAPLPTEALFIHNLGCVMAAELALARITQLPGRLC